MVGTTTVWPAISRRMNPSLSFISIILSVHAFISHLGSSGSYCTFQTVDIDFQNATVYVDGKALEEPYIGSPTVDPEGVSFPLTVDEGCVFVLGDNRENSQDSRHPEIGLIDTRQVLGKAIFLFFPGNDFGNSPRDFERLGGVG